CNPFHGGFDLFSNPRGNEWRRILVDRIRDEGGPPWDHRREGWPHFQAWPSWHDRLHQQARAEWLERAWRGGPRGGVALAVNSHVLADAAETQGPYDDRSSADAQLAALTALVGRHDFMRIARSAGELRNIVDGGRLAVVLGVELDGLGNFYLPANTQR